MNIANTISECQVELTALQKNILRVKITPHSRQDYVCALDKYGFMETLPGDQSAQLAESKLGWALKTECAELFIDKKTGCLTLKDQVGKVLLHQRKLDIAGGNVSAVFDADPDEDYAGFGDVSRKRCWHRGHQVCCNLTNVLCYIASPFFMSTRGYGLLVNTTYRCDFDMAKTDPAQIGFTDRSGVFDIYLFVGSDCKNLLSLYTRLTGRPKLPPVWSFGLWHICNDINNARDTVEDGLHYRDREIPCDVIGLEPGWMAHNYDYSTKKTWDPVKFPKMYPQFKFRNRTFLDALKNGMGFHFELWLCEDYDLTYEEERRIGKTGVEQQKEIIDDEEFDRNLLRPVLHDPYTIPEEPWFEHLKNFVDFGADFFKTDAATQVLPHPDRRYGNGMSDDECHNFYPLMLTRQMYEGFKEYTNRRPFIFTPCGWTTFQRWSGTWTGDTGARLETLMGMFNTSMLGHGLTTNDMGANNKNAIHFGYLLPLSQINNYSSFKMPWVWGKEIQNFHKFYSSLRSRLIPYLYSCMYQATQDGIPMLLPPGLEFQNDPACREARNSYLLGPALLVSIYEPELYLPEGKWQDFWTGKIYTGKQKTEVPWPDDRGGGLFLREGAILPLGPVMQYRGEREVDAIELLLFPGSRKTRFTYYEDDGITFEYENGKFSLTEITLEKLPDKAVLHIEQGAASKVKTWNCRVTLENAPAKMISGVKEIPFEWDPARHELTAVNLSAGETLIFFE